MSSRPIILATIVGASVGASYLSSHSSTGKGGAAGAPPGVSAPPPQSSNMVRLPGVSAPSLASPAGQVGGLQKPAAPINGLQFTSIAQVLRFDVTKEWVYQNWDRKSTGPTDVGLFSIRVPLVMAPRMTGLAGALTYYFNAQGQVEHISFRGRTGDSTELVRLLTTTYGLQRVGSPTGEQVYQVRSGSQIQSELRTRPEPILHSSAPNQSIAVELELARPGSERVLPPRPTGLAIPQVGETPASTTATPTASAATNNRSGAAESGSGSYFDKVRYATPKEEAQVLFKRWPK